MFAHQLIYTACGKDKSGAFSVWAKSDQVTKAECDEIIKLMSYKKPKNSPYEPTPEELRTLFPKKYGYFILSTGRKCVAQTTYLGRVYSDLDGRSGNFIIHAYIFDQLENVNPFDIIGSDIFKTELTYTEWHDQPAPDSLPAVNLQVQGSIRESELKAFLLKGDNAKNFANLLQAIIESVKGEKVVTFNSTEEEQKIIYKLISLLLPKETFDKTSFVNQYSPQVEYILATNGVPPIKIRNIFEGGSSYAFNYESEIAEGNYAFNFDRGLFANLQAGPYVKYLVNGLVNSTLFETLKKVDKVNEVTAKLNCDADTAVSVFAFISQDFSAFTCASDFTKALNLVLNANYIDKNAYAKKIYNDILRTNRWGFGREVKEIIDFVYKYGDDECKNNLMIQVLNNLSAFGISQSQSYETFFADFKANMPFGYDDLIGVASKTTLVGEALCKSNNDGLLFVYFDILVNLLGKFQSGLVTNNPQSEIIKLFRKAVAEKNTQLYSLQISKIARFGAQAQLWLVRTALPQYFEQKTTSADQLRCAFEIVLAVKDSQAQAQLANLLIKINIDNTDLLPVYIDAYDKNQTLFDNIERSLVTRPEYKTFFGKKNAYVFKKMPVSKQSLLRYFEDCYVQGLDSGVFLFKFKELIAQIRHEELKIKELLSWYPMIAKLPNSFGDVVNVIQYIEKEIYSNKLDDLLRLDSNASRLLYDMNERLLAINPNMTSKKFEVFGIVSIMQGKQGKQKTQEIVVNNMVYVGLSAQQIELISRDYLHIMLNVFVDMRKTNGFNLNNTLVSLLNPVVARVTDYKNDLKTALEKVGGEDYFIVMAQIMSYAFNQQNAFADRLKAFVKWYVENSPRGLYTKLFKKVETLIDKNELINVQKFIDEFMDNHKSFWDMLFGSKKK